MSQQPIIQVLRRYSQNFHQVVPFKPGKDGLLKMDFTEANKALTASIIDDTAVFSGYVHDRLEAAHCRYGIGGYDENRSVYSRSRYFDSGNEPRTLHLGADVWGAAGTPVHAFMGGMVHSFAYNDHFGDYGATIILLHQLDGIPFYTLYGHLCLKDIKNLADGQYVIRGQTIGHFGEANENGSWPPHLHLQIIMELGIKKGDYPGVCKYSEREKYLHNCPDPDLILQMNQYADNLKMS